MPMRLFAKHQGRFAGLIWALSLLAQNFIRAEEAIPEATNLWEVTLPFPAFGSAPTLAPDGTIYQGTLDGTLLALTPGGDTKWQFKSNREIKSTPAVTDDGTLYFGCRDGNLYAVDPNGQLKWTFPTPAWIDSSPAIAADGTIYFGGWDHYFYALNPNGSLKWKVDIGAIIESSPAVAVDGTIYFGAHDKKLYALDPNGKAVWNFPTKGTIISSPAIGPGGDIYFTSLDGNLYRLNPAGKLVWSYHSGSSTESSPVLTELGEVCVGRSDCTFVVNTNGIKHWHSGSAVPMDVSGVTMGDHFYFSVPWQTVQGVTAIDHRLWRADLEANASASLTLGPDGIFYVVAEKKLYAIRPPGPALPPAKSSWPMFHANARHTGRAGDVKQP